MTAAGDIRRLKLGVGIDEIRRMRLNGKSARAVQYGTDLLYQYPPGGRPLAVSVDRHAPRRGPVSARWRPGTLRLPTGGSAWISVELRNNGQTDLSGALLVDAPQGITIEPARMDLTDFAAGEERSFTLKVQAGPNAANQLQRISLRRENLGLAVIHDEGLPISVGVAMQREQLWPGEFACKIFSPRYVLRIPYSDTVAATMLLDPDGLRRHGTGNKKSFAAFPRVYLQQADGKGWTQSDLPGYAGFAPRLQPGTPGYLADSGKHPHGYQSKFSTKFTEDWIWLRARENAFPAGPLLMDWRTPREITSPKALEALPPVLMIATAEGIQTMDPKKDAKSPLRNGGADVEAVFRRPTGYRYGELMLLPKGTRYQDGGALLNGDRSMAFTFCTVEELPALLEKWREQNQ